MDHLEAHQTQAAERYLLGELTAVEAEEFERHYFECAHCAAAVESGELFAANARAYFREPDKAAVRAIAKEPKPSFWQALAAFWRKPFFSLPLAAALVCITIYQGAYVIPSLRRSVDSAGPLDEFQLTGASRGAGTVIRASSRSPFIALAVDLPPGLTYQRFLCVVSSGDRTIFQVSPVEAPADGQPLRIYAPVKNLTPGNLELTVFGLGPGGQQADKISAWPFEFQFK
ncbi:MAG TPA: zf-HC2 domain-containing protein [Bryobacteraceae bacterium]|nr:zf-HC2 domain-containing protein [Bryobacteraceae bacterium]